jgi:MFS family permease
LADPVSNEQPDVLYCANHPKTQTVLRCNRCGKPICTKCAVRTPVGYRCKECINQQQAVYYTAGASDYLIAAGETLAFTTVAGFVAPLLVGFIGFYGWLAMIFIAPALSGVLSEAVRRSIGRRRGRYLGLLACGVACAGSIIGFGLLWAFTRNAPLLSFGIYLVLFVSALYARLR